MEEKGFIDGRPVTIRDGISYFDEPYRTDTLRFAANHLDHEFVLSWKDPDYSTHIGDIIAVAPFFETKMLDMFKNGDFGPDATFVGGMDSKCFGNNCI